MNNAELLKKSVCGLELSSITLLKEYMQLNFDGPVFNFYASPTVQCNDQEVSPSDEGYYDTIHKILGERLVSVQEVPEAFLGLTFENGYLLRVSLNNADRSSVEIAMFQDSRGGGWVVW